MDNRRRQLGQGLETLERRDLLTSVPFGATSQDTAEFVSSGQYTRESFLAFFERWKVKDTMLSKIKQ